MAIGRLRRFEVLILKPLSILFLLTAGVFLVLTDWLVVALCAIDWFLVGHIGQSINKEKALHNLMKGTGLTLDDKANTEISPDESYAIGKPLLQLSVLMSITSFILCLHYDVKWYIAIALAIVVYGIFAVLFLLVTVRPKKA